MNGIELGPKSLTGCPTGIQAKVAVIDLTEETWRVWNKDSSYDQYAIMVFIGETVPFGQDEGNQILGSAAIYATYSDVASAGSVFATLNAWTDIHP